MRLLACTGLWQQPQSPVQSCQFAAEVVDFLRTDQLRCEPCEPPEGTTDRPLLLVGKEGAPPALALHLLRTPRSLGDVLPRTATADLSDAWEARRSPTPLVHLWEDIWRSRNDIVCSRLRAMSGGSRRLMARNTEVRRIDAATLEKFLVDHHLWGPTQARFRYGLYHKPLPGESERELVAVASFSARRHVLRGGERYRSHELIRYCSRRGESVAGGISKLMKTFEREMEPDDLVTVIDRDWGGGGGWGSLGFEVVQNMLPVPFYVGPDGHRCHALGTGNNPWRRQLPPELIEAFEMQNEMRRPGGRQGGVPEGLSAFLATERYFELNDAGALRMLRLLKQPAQTDDHGVGTAANGIGAVTGSTAVTGSAAVTGSTGLDEDEPSIGSRTLWEETRLPNGKKFFVQDKPPGDWNAPRSGK